MKPLIVLLIAFCLAVLGMKLFSGRYDLPLAGRVALCAMLVFTATGHFAFTKGMSLMVPGFIPFKTELVLLTGGLEVLLGTGLLVPGLSSYAAWTLIMFFIVLLPANINAAIKHIDYQKGTFDGKGLSYLWFRVPLQLLFIAWVYLSVFSVV
jgi:uncharacterized membrane protein